MSRGSQTLSADRLLVEARRLSTELDRLSNSVATRIGLSPTELLAIDLMSRGDGIPAGHLARDLNLTTGAITGLIDRLERSGYARRRADSSDRRRVIVASTAKEAHIRALYSPLAQRLRRALTGYSEAELATVMTFLQNFRTIVSEAANAVHESVPKG